MDPESKKLLEETLSLEKENNSMLHRIRRVQRLGTLWSGLKILVIIGIAFGAFYFLEPTISKIISIWDSISGSPQQESITPIQDFIKKFSN